MSIIAIVAICLGGLVSLGAIAQFLRGSYDRGTIVSLTNSNTALEQEVRVLKGQVASLQADNKALGIRVESLTAIATQANEIAHLQRSLDEHDSGTRALLAAIKDAVS